MLFTVRRFGAAMQGGEGKELVEYALIAIVALLGAALILSGLGPALMSLWRAATATITG